eukprot:1031840-Amphidinium_carterae.1
MGLHFVCQFRATICHSSQMLCWADPFLSKAFQFLYPDLADDFLQNAWDRHWSYVIFGVFPQCHHSGYSRDLCWNSCVREGKDFQDELLHKMALNRVRVQLLCDFMCPPVAVWRPPFPELRDRFADGGLRVERC